MRVIMKNSKIVFDGIVNVMNIVSANTTSTMLTNSNDKKVRYKMECYTLRTILLMIILLFIIAIIWYHYRKHRLKQKDTDTLIIQIWRIT